MKTTKEHIEKLIKALYSFVEENKQLTEDLAMQEETGLSAEEEQEYHTSLGMLLLADLKLQDAMLTWVNANNLQNLTVEQRADLFGILAEFRHGMDDVQ